MISVGTRTYCVKNTQFRRKFLQRFFCLKCTTSTFYFVEYEFRTINAIPLQRTLEFFLVKVKDLENTSFSAECHKLTTAVAMTTPMFVNTIINQEACGTCLEERNATGDEVSF
jgi:hypothetical protein